VSESIRFLPRVFEGVPEEPNVTPDVLVLDGQRIAIFGLYARALEEAHSIICPEGTR